MADVLHGMWVSDSPHLACTPDFLDRAHEDLGMNVLAVMVDSSAAPWDARWSPLQFERFCRMAIDRAMEVVCTWWPYPSREILDVALGALKDYLSVGAIGVEPDVEGLWTPRHVRGFADLGEASRYLTRGLLRLRRLYDVRLELTTHPFHDEGHWTPDEVERFEHDALAGSSDIWRSLAPHADRLCWQGYSCTQTPSGDPVPWGSKWGPGRMQTFTFDRARAVPGQHKLTCGLAAYRQKWEGHQPSEAMMIAYNAALDYEPVEIRYWDSRVIMGSRANGYAYNFLRGLRSAKNEQVENGSDGG